MPKITTDSIKEYFDDELRRGRRLLPDPKTLAGLGSYLKYYQAAELMAGPAVRNVLDIGCNRGSVEALFHAQFPAESQTTFVEAVDISSEAIRQAGQLALPNCTFRTYDGVTLPYDDDSFDLVVMIEVIEHVVEKEQMLREVRRVLRPAGKLLLTTPNPECWPLRIEAFAWGALRRVFGRSPIEKDEYVSHDGLTTVLRSNGFQSSRAGSMYSQLRLFVQLMGWSLLPPLPPKLLYRYHKFCLTRIGCRELPRFIERHFKWSLIAEMQKSA